MSEHDDMCMHAFKFAVEIRGEDQPKTDDLIRMVKEFFKDKAKVEGWDTGKIDGAMVCCDDSLPNFIRWEMIMDECDHYLSHIKQMDKEFPIGDGSEGILMFEKSISWLRGYGRMAVDLIHQTKHAVRDFVDKLKSVADLPLNEQLEKIPTELLREIAAKKGHPNPGLESHAALIDWMVKKGDESTQVN